MKMSVRAFSHVIMSSLSFTLSLVKRLINLSKKRSSFYFATKVASEFRLHDKVHMVCEECMERIHAVLRAKNIPMKTMCDVCEDTKDCRSPSDYDLIEHLRK